MLANMVMIKKLKSLIKFLKMLELELMGLQARNLVPPCNLDLNEKIIKIRILYNLKFHNYIIYV